MSKTTCEMLLSTGLIQSIAISKFQLKSTEDCFTNNVCDHFTVRIYPCSPQCVVLQILSLSLYIKSNSRPGGATKAGKSPEEIVEGAAASTKDLSNLFPEMDGDSRKHFMVSWL